MNDNSLKTIYDYVLYPKDENNKSKLLVDLTDKEQMAFYHILNMYNRTQSIFEYEGLPDTIPQRNLELMLQINGYCGFIHSSGKDERYPDGIYAVYGGLGGEPNPYYMPTKFIVANPALKLETNTFLIDKDCVIMPNDSLYQGLFNINRYNATMIVESDITLRCSLINTRITQVISAGDDSVYEGAKKYLKDIEDGKLGVIKDQDLFDTNGIKVQCGASSQNATSLMQLIETSQYRRAMWFNDLGLQSNYNMKRESLTESETSLNDSILLPLIDDMLEQRVTALDKVNKMFGLNITVKLRSSWAITHEKANPEHDGETDEDGDDLNNNSIRVDNTEEDKKNERQQTDVK
jgi:hypothetical protein